MTDVSPIAIPLMVVSSDRIRPRMSSYVQDVIFTTDGFDEVGRVLDTPLSSKKNVLQTRIFNLV